MSNIFETKPILNKANKQISITIPKKQFKMFKNGIPKTIKVEIKGVKW